jgi:hypothetical protein
MSYSEFVGEMRRVREATSPEPMKIGVGIRRSSLDWIRAGALRAREPVLDALNHAVLAGSVRILAQSVDLPTYLRATDGQELYTLPSLVRRIKPRALNQFLEVNLSGQNMALARSARERGGATLENVVENGMIVLGAIACHQDEVSLAVPTQPMPRSLQAASTYSFPLAIDYRQFGPLPARRRLL